jgi:hypothetical protein
VKISDLFVGVKEISVTGPKIIHQFKFCGITINFTETIVIILLMSSVNNAVVFILEMLDNFGKLNYQKQDVIEVTPDFISEKTTADIRIDFSLRVCQIIDIALKTFVSYIKSKNKNTK